MNDHLVSTADLNGIIRELVAFLRDELDFQPDLRGLTHMQAIQCLWDYVQTKDPDPEPKISAYIGGDRLGAVADSLLFEPVP